MLERVKVPPFRSGIESLPAAASACSRDSSCATCSSVSEPTSLMFGTSRPCGVSIATPMLCDPLTSSSDPSSEMEALSSGNSARAREVALTMSGISVNLPSPLSRATCLSCCRTSIRASIRTSSQKLKCGTAFAAVICANIAFRIPRIGTARSSAAADGAAGCGCGAAAAAPAGCTGALPLSTSSTSCLVTRPPLPVGVTVPRSSLCRFASARVAGVDSTLRSPAGLAAAAVAPAAGAGSLTGRGAAAAAATGGAGCSGSAPASPPAPSTEMCSSGVPTLAMLPTSYSSDSIVPT
mmetsp:Transcript_20633/g.66575  ORF Transcript_20633/g.66575 Transcript_20633/m.66575 type:complete len:295 (+) Transcript_20633:527-1411(+)